MDGLIAIPAYNEASTLREVINGLKGCFPLENFLIIDDGSTDDSLKILAELGVNYLHHPINLGYEETMKTAMHYVLSSNLRYVVFFDADGQHQLDDLRKIVEIYDREKYDLIVGSRYKENSDIKWSIRAFGTNVFSVFTTLFSGTKITDATCGLKLISRDFLALALTIPTEDMHAELIVGLARFGARVHETDIKVLPRKAGVSMYNFWKAFFYPAKTFLCVIAGRFRLNR